MANFDETEMQIRQVTQPRRGRSFQVNVQAKTYSAPNNPLLQVTVRISDEEMALWRETRAIIQELAEGYLCLQLNSKTILIQDTNHRLSNEVESGEIRCKLVLSKGNLIVKERIVYRTTHSALY